MQKGLLMLSSFWTIYSLNRLLGERVSQQVKWNKHFQVSRIITLSPEEDCAAWPFCQSTVFEFRLGLLNYHSESLLYLYYDLWQLLAPLQNFIPVWILDASQPWHCAVKHQCWSSGHSSLAFLWSFWVEKEVLEATRHKLARGSCH